VASGQLPVERQIPIRLPSSLSWEGAPQNERKLMVAAARLALLELAATSRESKRQYFAKPGEADWGC